MFGEIDLNLSPQKYEIFLSTPTMQVVHRIIEAKGINEKEKLGDISELNFSIPYSIDINHKLERNPTLDLIQPFFLIKVTEGDKEAWFTIAGIKQAVDAEGNALDEMAITAYSLGYELAKKNVATYSKETANLPTMAKDILGLHRAWSLGYVDSAFHLMFRSIDLSSVTALEALNEIANTFKALIVWDDKNRKVNFYNPQNIGQNRGLSVKMGKYMKSLEVETDTKEMTTILKAFGKDGLTFNGENITGTNYIEDFSYFLYPFERDENRNVIKHSERGMSDELCHAILDYQEFIETVGTQFIDLLEEKESLEEVLTTKNNELQDINNRKDQAFDNDQTQKAMATYEAHYFTYNGSTVTKNTSFVRPFATQTFGYKYAVMCKVSSVTNLTVKLDGTTKTLTPNQWVVLGKINSETVASSTLSFTGTATNVDVKSIYMRITDAEFAATSNNSALIEEYCLDSLEMEYAAKKAEIDVVLGQIDGVEDQIQVLKESLALESHFTPELLEERSHFEFEREWSNPYITEEKVLLEEAKKEFLRIREPQISFSIDIIDFMNIVEAQHDWDKLQKGDIITVKYENMDIHVKAKIIEIERDIDEKSIQLTIANYERVMSNEEYFWKIIHQSISTSTTVDNNKSKFGVVDDLKDEVSQIFYNTWEANKREIEAGVNENVEISRKGIIVRDPSDPLCWLIIQHGVLAITNDGGVTWKQAIRKDGIVAERLFGRIIMGNNLILGDEDGILEIRGNKMVIKDRNGVEVMKMGLYEVTDDNQEKFGMMLLNDKNKVIVDRNDGFKIRRKTGITWEDVAWLDLNGQLNIKGLKINSMTGELQQGITLNQTEGLMITRADQNVRVVMNATSGIKIQKRENGVWVDKLYADTNGTLTVEDLIAKSVLVQGADGSILLDARKKILNLEAFDLIVGKLTAENIEALQFDTTLTGDIISVTSNLTANRLKTVTHDILNDDIQNYVEIRGNFIRFANATKIPESQTHVRDKYGKLVYWTSFDPYTRKMTYDVTPFPAYSYQYESKDKFVVSLAGTGDESFPWMQFGQANDDGNEIGNIYKDANGFSLNYLNDYGVSIGCDLKNDGMYLTGGRFVFGGGGDGITTPLYPLLQFGQGIGDGEKGKAFISKNPSGFSSYFINDNGQYRGVSMTQTSIEIEVESGSFTVTGSSAKITVGGSTFELKSNGDINVYAAGNLNLNAGGRVNIG